MPPVDHATYDLQDQPDARAGAGKLRHARNRAVLATLVLYRLAENAGLAAVGYRLQYYQLLAQPFYLAAMVLLAAAVSLRLFRFGGVQKMVLGGIAAGFLLYVLSKVTGDLSKAGLMPPLVAAGLAAAARWAHRACRACCTRRTGDGAPASARPAIWSRAASLLARRAAAIALAASLARLHRRPRRAHAQQRQIVAFPARPKPPASPASGLLEAMPSRSTSEQMLVRADEINYDYTNERVSAVGNVQIYYGGATLEADKVIYDQKTKRLHAEGNVRLTEPTARSPTARSSISATTSATASSIRCGSTRPSRPAWPPPAPTAASGNITVLQSGVYTACEPCEDDPRKPPKWQVKAARIIHDQGEKMMYFEDARLEFFGVPLAYHALFLGARSDREAQERLPDARRIDSSSIYGVAVTTPYYWALAPNYDVTITPMITTKQGPLVQGEWRQRLMNGSYTIRGAGIFQLDQEAFVRARRHSRRPRLPRRRRDRRASSG